MKRETVPANNMGKLGSLLILASVGSFFVWMPSPVTIVGAFMVFALGLICVIGGNISHELARGRIERQPPLPEREREPEPDPVRRPGTSATKEFIFAMSLLGVTALVIWIAAGTPY